MKVLAMYLPQFHRVKENDEWWGDGFTEWTAVKNATPLYDEHFQPRIPMHNNYYDLMQKDTMSWQSNLMQKYGIGGMCFYHYWFKEGRQILEKPAENLLKWQDIDMPFCFCWANETWARSWCKISSKNPWANTFEKQTDENDSGILLEQKYGDESDWRQHFEYLVPFFRDDRYIKINNKPVFLIYKTSLITCLDEMLEKWNLWARKNDFDGIYVIGANTNSVTEKIVDRVLYHEPQRSNGKVWSRYNKNKTCLTTEYSDVWNEILDGIGTSQCVSYGGFVGYDDTPRRGKEGKIVVGQTPELFKKYLTELIAKNEVNDSPFTFINAWNEWGEGMYLEPDEKDGYAYLEAIPYAKEHYKEYIEKYQRQLKNSDDGLLKEYNALSEKCARYEGYWRILDAWLSYKEDGLTLEKFFIKQEIKSIAIYGGGMLGKHLLVELKDSSIKVAYVIDRKADALNLSVPVYSPEDILPEVDAVVVTATYAYAEIKKQLEKKCHSNIYSLENILFEVE